MWSANIPFWSHLCYHEVHLEATYHFWCHLTLGWTRWLYGRSSTGTPKLRCHILNFSSHLTSIIYLGLPSLPVNLFFHRYELMSHFQPTQSIAQKHPFYPNLLYRISSSDNSWFISRRSHSYFSVAHVPLTKRFIQRITWGSEILICCFNENADIL